MLSFLPLDKVRYNIGRRHGDLFATSSPFIEYIESSSFHWVLCPLTALFIFTGLCVYSLSIYFFFTFFLLLVSLFLSVGNGGGGVCLCVWVLTFTFIFILYCGSQYAVYFSLNCKKKAENKVLKKSLQSLSDVLNLVYLKSNYWKNRTFLFIFFEDSSWNSWYFLIHFNTKASCST